MHITKIAVGASALAALFCSVATAQGQSPQKPPACGTTAEARLASISYTPRPQEAQVADLRDELASITAIEQARLKVARDRAAAAKQAAPVADAVDSRTERAAVLLDAGRKLEAVLAGDGANRTTARLNYEAARGAYIDYIAGDWLKGRQAREQSTERAGKADAKAERLSKALMARDDAEINVIELSDAERAARVQLDEMKPENPQRAAAQKAYYDALVGEAAAIKAFNAASAAYSKEMAAQTGFVSASGPACESSPVVRLAGGPPRTMEPAAATSARGGGSSSRAPSGSNFGKSSGRGLGR